MVRGSRVHLSSVSRDFLTLSPADAVVTRLASPAPIELKHVERLRAFNQALNVRPEEVADRLHEVLKPDMIGYLHHNLRRIEYYGTYPWDLNAWRRFLDFIGFRPGRHRP